MKSHFEEIVRSETPSGTIFENTLTEVLTHLLNHAEHHQGQILWIITKETGEYVPSLYMPYLRSGKSTTNESSRFRSE